MPTVTIDRETEEPRGWEFEATVLTDGGLTLRRTLHLAWVDYNHWSPGGTDRPEAVAAAVLEYLARRGSLESTPRRLDAAGVRRRDPDADAAIPDLIRENGPGL